MAYTKDIGLLDFYKFYKEAELRKGRIPKSYKLFSDIIKDGHLLLREKLVYNSETFILPYKMGELKIQKFNTVYNEDNRGNWRVDFKATKEAGHVIYHGSPYGYRWFWNKRAAVLSGKRYYKFKPCRTASRLIADAVNNKQLDYYN